MQSTARFCLEQMLTSKVSSCPQKKMSPFVSLTNLDWGIFIVDNNQSQLWKKDIMGLLKGLPTITSGNYEGTAPSS